MTNRKGTKRALLSSMVALLICFSMLVGTTLAWFTDSVTSEGNIIQSGTLEIGMYWANGTEAPDSAKWNDASKGEIFTYNNWEPGYVDVRHIKIVNEGTLALKYQLTIADNGNSSILTDVIDVYFIDGATQITDRTQLSENNKVGTLTEVINGMPANASGTLISGDYDIVTIALKMQEDAGNEYQGLKFGEFAVKLIATQLTAETDSFDDQYDADANTYEPWDGTTDTAWYDANETEFVLKNAEQLAGLAELVNTGTDFSGKTIKLGTDVDLKGLAWTPIGDCTGPTYFKGTFDGQSNVIANLTVNNTSDSQYASSGLFGWVDVAGATIQNVVLSGASVSGHHWVGAIAGYITGTVSNCKVIDSSVLGTHANDDADGDKVGGIVGFANTKSELIGNSIVNTSVIGNRDVGGIAGAVVTDVTMTSNSVTGSTVGYETEKTYASAGLIVSGRTGFVPDETNTATNSVVKQITTVADSNALADAFDNGGDVLLTDDVTTNKDIAGDVSMNLNGNTLTMISSDHKTQGDLTITNGTVDISKGYFDVRPTDSSTITFENVVFTNTAKGLTFGNSTDRVEPAMEFCPAVLDGSATVVFKNCTFNNTNVVFEAMSGKSGSVTATFEGCTFNNLGNSDAFEIQNYLTVDLTIKDCEFNMVATSNICIVDALGSSDVTVTFEGANVVNGTAATPTDSSVAGTVDEIRVFTTQSVKVASAAVDVVNGLDTVTVSGIAKK